MNEPKSIVVQVYLNQVKFRRYVQMAEKIGTRRTGLLFKPKKQRSMVTEGDHFEPELTANKKGLSKAFQKAADYYLEHEAERLAEQARLAQEEKELLEKKKKLGMI